MLKRNCIFNDQLQKEFDYVKKGRSEHDVLCTHCGSEFCTVDVLTSKTTCSVTKYAMAQVIHQWVESGTGTGQKWLKIF